MSEIEMQSSNSRSGQWFLCLLGLSLILMGALFAWLLLRSYQNANATRDWIQAEAVILRAEVEQRQIQGSPVEYRLSLLFGYDFDGKSYTSDKLSPRGAKWSRDQEVVIKLREEYAEQSVHTAWVNPDEPSLAILKHDTKAAGYTIWFPVLFIIAGGGMIWGAFGKSGKTPVIIHE